MRPVGLLVVLLVGVSSDALGGLPHHDQESVQRDPISVRSLRRAQLQETNNNQLITPVKIGDSVVISWHPPPTATPPQEDPEEHGPSLSLAEKVSAIDIGGGCFSSHNNLVFDFTPDGDFFEDDFDTFGTRRLWTGGRLATLDNQTVGTTSGACTVIAETQSDKAAEALCSLYYQFSNGSLGGSTLASTGIYKGGRSSGIGAFTITSGTGCFAGSQGLILQTVMGGSVVRSSIGLE